MTHKTLKQTTSRPHKKNKRAQQQICGKPKGIDK